MQEKRMKVWKRATALLMSAILVAVSLPIALAAVPTAGSYDPTPTFAEDATLWAWETDEGSVTVSVPEATPVTTYIADKHIATYYITLYDLGLYTEVHNDPATESVPSAKITLDATTVTFAAGDTFEVTFPAGQLEAAGITMDGTHRLSVEVLAQDSTGWVSEPITTTVSDVPRFEYEEEAYTPLTENATGMREMLMFEARNNDVANYVSDNGAGGGRLDYIQSGNQLTMLGRKEQAGAENTSGTDTSAYGFRVNGTGAQSFNTTWSRQHWIAEGAEEVWFWFDFSQVSVEGLAFELKTQGKRYNEFYVEGFVSDWRLGQDDDGYEIYDTNRDDEYSAVTYSTKGYTGNDGYVYIQADDGSWQAVALENGGINLSDYKGYVRVPIEFICSTSATYAEASNLVFNQGTGSVGLGSASNAASAFRTNVLFSEPVLIDEAGTPISEALLIQYRRLGVDTAGAWSDSYYVMPENGSFSTVSRPDWGASMLAVGPDYRDIDTGNDGTKAYIENGQVMNRENGYKALDDICGAGFSYTGMSADSVNKSFYLDSVMFYKSEGNYPNDMTEGEYGLPLTDYYDQSVEIPRSILYQINDLISSPDAADYRAIQYVEEMLDGYRTAYASVGNDFLSEENLANTAASLGMSTAWQNFIDARAACLAAGTIVNNDDGTYTYPSNNTAYDLVPDLIRSLEKLPEPSTVASVSDTLESEIVRLWQIYRRLNLTQLDAMSNEEEQKMLEYAALASDAINEDLLIGQAMADNAFVAFNTLDNANTVRGQEAYRLENDVNAAAGANSGANSYRFTKGLLGYTTSLYNFHGASAVNNDESGRDATTDGMDVSALRAAGADVVITGNGAANSNGATVMIDNSFAGEYNVVSVSKDGLNTANATGMYSNNLSGTALGDLAAVKNSGVNSSFPLGLVFYVDFSEISNFYMTATISTVVNGTALDFAFNPGAEQSWQTFYLMNEATGEWVQVQGSGNASAVVESSGVTNSAGVDLQLDGYKGFVMLPLYHFKQTINQRDNAMLDESAEALNNIWRVSIGIAPRDSSAAAAMDGHSFTVDTIGFGYNSSADAYGNHGHQTFGEQYGVKTFRAAAFEEVVAALEPQASGNAFNLDFREAVNAAKAQYDALSAYEQNLPSTQNAYAILNRYITDIANNNTADYAWERSPSDIYNVSFPNLGLSGTLAVADGNTSGEYDLPYPGVIDTNGDGRADAVNYGAYGLTAETAAQIIEWYNTSYSRWTEEQKNQSPEMRRQFLNAYNAAMRCYNTLEHVLDEGDAFLNELFTVNAPTSLYRTMSTFYPAKADADGLGTAGDGTVYAYDKSTPYGTHVTADGQTVDEGYFISLTDRDPLLEISDLYRNETDYYAKYLLASGDLQVGVDNIPMAVRKLLNNSAQYTDASGATVYGGVRTLYYRYRDLLQSAQSKVNSGTALTQTELDDLVLATQEYEALIDTYHDVAELYDIIQQIYDLFPAVTSTLTATGSSPSTNQTILLSYDGEATTVENTVDPVYTLTQFEQYLTDPNGTGTLTMTSQNGGLLKSADGSTSLAYELTYGGQAADFSGGAIEIGSYSAPMSAGIAMHVKISNPQAFPTELSDVVTLTYTYQYTDRFGILREATDVKTVTIRYATDDMYVVEVPAEVEIPWGSDSVQASYAVTCNLNEGSTIDVGITPAAASFDLSANGTAETISCTADSPAAATYSGTQIEAAATNPMTISVASSEWEGKPLAEYRADDQITYTVSYTDGSTTP